MKSAPSHIAMLAALAAFGAPLIAHTQTPAGPSLESQFQTPANDDRPRTLWFWMNGNVTRDGITRDMEAMKAVGLGGVMIFDGSIDVPTGPVRYLDPQWRSLMSHVFHEGQRLGLDVGMHNAPGWSSSGGPWITPERAMQQLVWTETTVTGGRTVDVALPQPFTKLDYYRDSAVVAFPSQPGEQTPFANLIASVSANGQPIDAALVTDQNLETTVSAAGEDGLRFQFKAPFEARALTIYAEPESHAVNVTLEASDDGVAWRPVAQLNVPAPRGVESPGLVNFDAVTARYFRVKPAADVKLAEVRLHSAPRIKDWNFKADYAFRLPTATEDAPADLQARAAIDPASVIDVTRFMGADGKLHWDAPAGSWTILRVGHTPTGKHNVAASEAGDGLEVDKFDRDAVDFFFANGPAKVLDEAGDLAGPVFKFIEIDSYEAELQNWSTKLPEDFKAANGYDITSWLPALTGRVVGDIDQSDRFLFDFRQTLGDLMAVNYYDRMRELAHSRGVQLYVEGYGPGMFDELTVSGRADVPMSEFWARTPWTDNRMVKLVSSAAHIYGKPITAAESFTAEAQTGRWEEYPYALKTLGDLMFTHGTNRIYFHRYAHQPHPDAAPGMAMGPWGINLDRTNTWFSKSRPWMDYLARSQVLLRQGQYVADIAYFVGEDSPVTGQYTRPTASPNSLPLLASLTSPGVPDGYNFDHVNAEVLQSATVANGRLVLASGASYRLLVIPDGIAAMTPELAVKVRGLVEQGLVMLAPKPRTSLSLRHAADAEISFQQAVDTVWGDGAVTPVTGRTVGQGRVFVGATIQSVMDELKVGPDADCTTASPDGQVAWLHRTLDDRELYFVANRQRRAEKIVCSFRVQGLQPELWNAETGAITRPAVFEEANGRARVAFDLDPAQSTFVVYRRHDETPESWVARNGVRFAAVTPAPVAAPAPPPADTFTVSFWAKPDIELRLMPEQAITGRLNETGKNYVLPTRAAEDLYGAGTAVAGVAVGRNGVYVQERTQDASPAVLVSNIPVAGWTHVAVTYDHGLPSLYVNGTFVKSGLKSGHTVRPAVDLPPEPVGVTYFFEGDNTRPEVVDRVLSAEEIAAIAARGVPVPELRDQPADVTLAADGSLQALVWQSGAYTTSSGRAFTAEVAAPVTVEGAWTVSFPPNLGAPASIELQALTSLSRHPDPGVAHFSGNATYRKTITLMAPKAGERVYLDLGRVEVIAGVKVNGRDVGLAWKEPYRLDITDAVRAGDNTLEIEVATLWTNRLIGDEALPVEGNYRPAEWAASEPGRSAENRRGTVMAQKIDELPEWYATGQPKPPGGRVTFSPWRFYRADEPLVDSGLAGPVRVVFAREVTAR